MLCIGDSLCMSHTIALFTFQVKLVLSNGLILEDNPVSDNPLVKFCPFFSLLVENNIWLGEFSLLSVVVSDKEVFDSFVVEVFITKFNRTWREA